MKEGHHIISRLRMTAVAFYPADQEKGKRGRPRRYGKKVVPHRLFEQLHRFVECPSPVYGEEDVIIRYLSIDLLWKPVGGLVRFVLVDHPNRGRIMLLSSDIALDPIQIITAYGYRFKIELSFKQAINVLGTYTYHFWMKEMDPISRRSGNQYPHRKTKDYRDHVRRKIHAYHIHVALGCVAQGILIHLSLNHSRQVWDAFRGWLRTMRKDLAPSELVVANALRTSLPQFLLSQRQDNEFTKFLSEQIDSDRAPGLLLAG